MSQADGAFTAQDHALSIALGLAYEDPIVQIAAPAGHGEHQLAGSAALLGGVAKLYGQMAGAAVVDAIGREVVFAVLDHTPRRAGLFLPRRPGAG